MNKSRLMFIGLLSASLLWPAPSMLYAETKPIATATGVENIESLKDAATNAIKNKDWTSALSLLDRYLQLKPEDAEFHRKHGSVLGKLGRNEEAITSYQRAVELTPTSSDNWIGLCREQILTSAFVAARAGCEKAVALDPTSLSATVNLGHTYLLQGDATTAQEWYQKTLVNIESDEALKDGPLADFDIFIANNWQVKESVQAKGWFAKEGALWLERSAPVRKLLVTADAAVKKGDNVQAIALYEEHLPLLIALVGENHLCVANSLNKLAWLYDSQGHYAQAEPLFKRALAIREKALGPDHPAVATSLNKLAWLYDSQGHYAQAEPLLKRALAINEKALAPDHPDVAISLNNLATLYYNQGHYAQAELLYKRVLAINEKAIGPDHPDVASFLNDLALMYERQGHYAQAEPLRKRAVAIREKALGPDHPDLALGLNRLASLYYNQGQYTQAEPLYKRSLAIMEKALGPDHPDVASSLNNLALMYVKQGQYAQAEPLYKCALVIYEKALGLDHPYMASSLNNLATLYKTQGQYAQAEPLYKRSLAIREKVLGPVHPDTAIGLNNLALLYENQGQYAQAEPLYKRSLAISEKALGPDHPDVACSLNNLAALYESQGQYAQAEPLYKRSLAISEKALGPDHPDTATCLDSLASLYESQGQYVQAEPLYKRSLSIREKALGPDHPDTANILNNVALLYESQGQYVQAEPLYKRSLSIREKALGPDHPLVANSLNNLASVYKYQGQYAQAGPLYLRAWRIAGAAGEPELSWTVQENLCDFYSKSKPELAIWYGKQSINTLQTVRAGNTALDKDLQKSFLKKNEGIYKYLADLLFTQGRLMEGQQVLAMLKESEYFDFIQRSATDDPRKTTSSYTNREKPWSERYDTISSQLAALSKEYQVLSKREKASLITDAEKTRKVKLDEDLTIGRQAYDDFMVELQREFSKTATAERQQEFGEKNLGTLKALRGTLGNLGHGAVTLHYLMTDKRLWILLTTPTVQLKRESAISEADLNRQIGQYRDAIAQRDPKVKELGKALYDLIIGPVSEDLKQAGAQTLMLSLDGAMRYLPMAALYDGEKFLVERYRLAIYTEAAKDKLKDDPLAQWKFAGFGLTDKIEGYDELKSVRGELEGIAADAMEGDVKFNKDFTGASFKSALAKSPPVVHLSSHFVFKAGTEEDSFLLLGDGNKLSLKQMRDGDYMFTDVDLVTLSACDTAVGGGKDENGREVEGFGALAQEQGAKGVLATLWPVNDQSTGQFMQLFYGFRQKNPGMTKAEAMQKAQLAFIKGQVGPALAEVSRGKVIPTGSGKTVAVVTTTDHPYYWAPFILMGNWL